MLPYYNQLLRFSNQNIPCVFTLPLGALKIALSMFFLATLHINAQVADSETYLKDLKTDLEKKFPHNRTINLVFHGHSVPAGYWHNSEVHTLDSYPNLVLEKIKKKYPLAVVNVIVTAIGGENAIKGENRFKKDVLKFKPDVIFIDYALNDMWQNKEVVRTAWESMIQKALKIGIKVILITPSPDQRENMLDSENKLVKQAEQIEELAYKYHIGLANVCLVFQEILKEKGKIDDLMSHINHPNRHGHLLISDEIIKLF